jgi:hypothetical protein
MSCVARAVSALLLVLSVPLTGALPAQGLPRAGTMTSQSASLASVRLEAVSCTRVVDPKLGQGQVELTFKGHTRSFGATARISVRRGGQLVHVIDPAFPVGRGGLRRCTWDGRAAAGVVAPGAYEVVVEAPGSPALVFPVQVMRLGLRSIAVSASQPGAEWQMVYYKRQNGYGYYATPALHEYLNRDDVGEVSDLDHNDGSPRQPVLPHADVRQPALEGASYEDDRYNYPVALLGGASPVFRATLGSVSMSSSGVLGGPGYPASGLRLKARVVDDLQREWSVAGGDVVPGLAFSVQGPSLPLGLGRHELELTWSFLCSSDGGATWQPVAGSFLTEHVLYTLPGAPVFAPGAVGTQHAGPWVDVIDRIAGWGDRLGVSTVDAGGVMTALGLGFHGNYGAQTAAIEGVVYDSFLLGGDGGASHYYTGVAPSHGVQLSRLLDGARNGPFVNCSDCASAMAAMAAMAGVANVRLMRLGAMPLKAIRGIGASGYTLDLWGGVAMHAFSYHHVVTRDDGVSVSDVCLTVDEDGDPLQLPGMPGHNIDRPFAGGAGSYTQLVTAGPVSWSLESVPTVQ